MRKKQQLASVVFVAGEAFIIFLFFLLGGKAFTDVRILNLFVIGVIYASFFLEVFFPNVDFSVLSSRKFHSISFRWLIPTLYALSALLVMFCSGSLFHQCFVSQFLIQFVLFLAMVLSLIAIFHAAPTDASLYQHYLQTPGLIGEMRKYTDQLHHLIFINPEISIDLKQAVSTLNDKIRYLSPSDSQEALSLEQRYIDVIRYLIGMLQGNAHYVQDNFKVMLDEAEHLYAARKNFHSN